MSNKKDYFARRPGDEYFSPAATTPARGRNAYRDSKTGVFVSSGTLPGLATPYRTSKQKTTVTTYRLKRG